MNPTAPGVFRGRDTVRTGHEHGHRQGVPEASVTITFPATPVNGL
jgi:hypothetical protein